MEALLAAGYVVVALVSGAVPLWAHHSWPWTCPARDREGHGDGVRLGKPAPDDYLEVRADDGKIENTLVGGPAITRIEALGWTRTTVSRHCYRIAIISPTARNHHADRVLLADGQEMRLYGRQRKPARFRRMLLAPTCASLLLPRSIAAVMALWRNA